MKKSKPAVDTVGDLLEGTAQASEQDATETDAATVSMPEAELVQDPPRKGQEIAMVQPAPMPAQVDPVWALIDRALTANASVETLNGLYDLQKRYKADKAHEAFVTAMAAFKAEAPVIDKNKHVGFDSKKEGAGKTDYWHATLDNAVETISPIASKHGFSWRWKPSQDEKGLVIVTCIITHLAGHSEETTLRAPADQSGSKNNIQAVVSTTTYLSRTTLLMGFGLATGEDDDGRGSGDGGEEDYISKEQLAQLQEALAATNSNIEAFCRLYQIDALGFLAQKDFTRAMQKIAQKKARGAAK